MRSLETKLKDLEIKLIEIQDNKKRLRDKVQKRESEIHKKVIDIWKKEALNNKSFHADLDKIASSFKKLDPKNKRYFWKIFEFDISKKENLKDNFTFYVNDERLHFQLNLNGLYTDLSTSTESFKIDKIKKAKEVYLNEIIETFKDQNYL